MVGSPDKVSLKQNNSISISNRNPGSDLRGLPFSKNQKYLINSMEVYTFDDESDKTLIVILPIQDLKKVNKTYVLEHSKMLLKFFKKEDSDRSDKSFNIHSNRSILKKQQFLIHPMFRSSRTHQINNQIGSLESSNSEIRICANTVSPNELKSNPFLMPKDLNLIKESKEIHGADSEASLVTRNFTSPNQTYNIRSPDILKYFS